MKCKCPKCGFEFITKGITFRVLKCLKNGDMNISMISKELNIARPSVYYHINKLKEQGLIKEYFKDTKGKPHFIGLI